MKITSTADFAATPERVFAVLLDQAFQDAKVAATSTGSGSSATVRADGPGVVVETVRELSSDGLPDIARSFVGDSLVIHETQRWGAAAADGSRSGTIDLSVQGTPITLKGSLGLVPTASGSRQSLDAELKASIPLVGGKIEKAAAPSLEQGIETEHTLIRERL